MPQLVKKRRSGWAVLAVGAVIASILAVGASPAVATVQQPDAQATWKVCLGPALTVDPGQGFTDVSMGSVHYDNINCLAYYGITTGKTDDTFDPQTNVTRSQMALFLTRAARVADIDLGDAMGQDFTDLGGIGSDRVNAINLLAAKGIMEGRTATTFEPVGFVTRVDMAQHLFALLDLALDEIYIDDLPATVDGDNAGRIELNDFTGDRIGHRVDDYFGDVRRTLPAHVDDVVGAVYELGITTGTNDRVGEFGEFEPHANVTRAQMASFIIRALGHTNLRPAGLTAQSTSTKTQVSVRDAAFEPVVDQQVEVFSSSVSGFAFTRSRQCIDRYVDVAADNPGFDVCEIDGGDKHTDRYGNAELSPGLGGGPTWIVCDAGTAYYRDAETLVRYKVAASGIDDPQFDFKLWAWKGAFGDTVNANTELVEAVPANQPNPRTRAVTAVFSGGTSNKVKMGSTLNYEIQLVDADGSPVGPNPAGDNDSIQDYMVTITKTEAGVTLARSVTQMTPNDDGKIKIVVAHPDRVARDEPDVSVVVSVQRAADNRLRFVDATGGMAPIAQTADGTATNPYDQGFTAPRNIGAMAPAVIFSDDKAVATKYDIADKAWRELSPNLNRNTVSLTVLDQYGRPYGGTTIDTVTVDAAFTGNVPSVIGSAVDSGGRSNISYNYRTGTAITQMVTLAGSVAGPTVVDVYWAAVGEAGTTVISDSGDPISLLLADVRNKSLIVDADSLVDAGAVTPVAYLFGDDDEFMVGTTRLSLEQFVEVLMVAYSPDHRISAAGAMLLEWDGFNNNRPTDRATFTLTGLACQQPYGADREVLAN